MVFSLLNLRADFIKSIIVTGFFYFQTILFLHAQENKEGTGPQPAKGSYLYYGQPNIEDNSMFIEEAFNQETGVIQHISNFIFDDFEGGDQAYAYTMEIPMAGDRHQFSFTLSYPFLNNAAPGSSSSSGFGDVLLNYRPMLMDKNDWALLIPRFTLILPTGDSRNGFGEGAWGGQFNLALTKRLTSRLTSHYNAGYTFLAQADRHSINTTTSTVETREVNLHSYNVGASAIYLVSDNLNLMLEYVSSFEGDLMEDGDIGREHLLTLNPGFRCAFNIGKVQIVPGLGVPLFFTDSRLDRTGGFIYLSIEPDYTK